MTKAAVQNTKPGIMTGLLSLLIPGLGQIIQGKVRRGILILFSLITLTGLSAWRIHLLAHKEITWGAKLVKAFSRAPGFIIILIAGLIIVWLYNGFDSFKLRRDRLNSGLGLFIGILILFFTVGWQISEIDLIKMGREFPEAWPPLSKILWPWEAAYTYDEDRIEAKAKILVDDTENPPAAPLREEGKPYLLSAPTFGRMTTLDKNNNPVPGDTLHLSGSGYEPETLTMIWWADSIGNEFRPRQNGQYLTVVTDAEGNFETDLLIPYRLIPPSAVGQQFHTVKARQTFQAGGPKPSEALRLTIELMLETIFMGMMATFFGIIISIPISFLAARNLMSGSWITMTIYWLTRTVLNIIRSIESMIWALIAVVWVGLGPFAGILALTIHTIAALGKLYSESIESIDPGPIEAIQATGATKLQTIAYAVIPQMIPPFVSFTIYRWDINVRMSTIIGMVGGGGIGFLLVQYIRLLDYKSAGIAVWFIAITVAILDYVSAEIRQRFV